MKYSTIICHECQQKFNKSIKEIKRSKTGRHFCSRSCSAKYNNTITPKRKVEGNCYLCDSSISTSRKYCQDCYTSVMISKQTSKKNFCIDCQCPSLGLRCFSCYQSFRLKNKKINKKTCIDCGVSCKGKRCRTCSYKIQRFIKKYDTLGDAIYNKHHRSSAYALVRTRARAIAKKLGWNQCKSCGYDKHVEIAHIKPIKDFTNDTLISTINDESNLLPLCPNCHWEFDNGLSLL